MNFPQGGMVAGRRELLTLIGNGPNLGAVDREDCAPMDRLSEMEAFVRVVDLGGFTVVQLLKTVEPLPEPKCK